MTIKRKWGDTIPLELSEITALDGLPVTDLSGWELWFTIKADIDDADPGLLQKTKSGGGIITTGGIARFEITAAESRTLFQPDTTYLYEVQARDPQNRIITLDSGKLQLTKDLIRIT
jgi:hypothetical protein